MMVRYMTWSTNGFAGTILILDGKFSINGDSMESWFLKTGVKIWTSII